MNHILQGLKLSHADVVTLEVRARRALGLPPQGPPLRGLSAAELARFKDSERARIKEEYIERVRIRENARLKLEYARARTQKDPPLPPPHPAPPSPPLPPPTPGFPDSLSAATARYIIAAGRRARGESPPEPEPGEDGDRDQPAIEPPDPEHDEDDDQDDSPGSLILRAIRRRRGK